MSAPQFIPGPWHLSELPRGEWMNPLSAHAIDAVDPVDGALFEVAAVWGVDDYSAPTEASSANARLIAAAPDLFRFKLFSWWRTGAVPPLPAEIADELNAYCTAIEAVLGEGGAT